MCSWDDLGFRVAHSQGWQPGRLGVPSRPSFHYSVIWKHLKFQLLGGGHRSKSWDSWSFFRDGIPERDLKILRVKLHQRIHKIIVGEIERNNIYIYICLLYTYCSFCKKGNFNLFELFCAVLFSAWSVGRWSSLMNISCGTRACQ